MKKTIAIMALAMLAALQACRVNEGDIGVLYGIWMIDSMQVDGAAPDADLADYSLRFQGGLTQLTVLDGDHQYAVYVGKLERDGGTLTLDFRGTELPPPFGPLSDQAVAFDVKTETSKALVLDSPDLSLRLRKLK